MGFRTDNIDMVRVMRFAGSRLADGTEVGVPGLALVSWRSDESERLFQVYVNGRLSGVTVCAEQRMILVGCEANYPAAIEVVSVEADKAGIDYSGQLNGFVGIEPRVELRWLRTADLALGNEIWVYQAAGDDFSEDIEPVAKIAIWPDMAAKWGWGLDGMGKGDFGYSGSASCGCGKGNFGEGEFGFDADEIVFESELLEVGDYVFGWGMVESGGECDIGELETLAVNVDPLPRAVELFMVNYDSVDDRLVLRIG